MKITTRDAWGSRKTTITDKVGALQRVYIHHTAGYYPVNEAEEIEQMLTLQHIAIEIKGYQDIDYNWVIGPTGTVYEARGLMKKSAATLDQNDVSRSICVMGNYQSDILTPQSGVAIVELAKFLVSKGDLTTLEELEVLGHRDNPAHLLATACPGNNIYGKLPAIRNSIKLTSVGDIVKARLMRQKGYLNVFVAGNGWPCLSVSEELMGSLLTEDPAVPKIFFDNMPAFRGMCSVGGLDIEDPTQVIPGGPMDKF